MIAAVVAPLRREAREAQEVTHVWPAPKHALGWVIDDEGFEANGLGLVDAANFVLRLKLVCRAFQNEVAESMRLRRHSVPERVEYSCMESNEGSPLVQHWCTPPPTTVLSLLLKSGSITHR